MGSTPLFEATTISNVAGIAIAAPAMQRPMYTLSACEPRSGATAARRVLGAASFPGRPTCTLHTIRGTRLSTLCVIANKHLHRRRIRRGHWRVRATVVHKVHGDGAPNVSSLHAVVVRLQARDAAVVPRALSVRSTGSRLLEPRNCLAAVGRTRCRAPVGVAVLRHAFDPGLDAHPPREPAQIGRVHHRRAVIDVAFTTQDTLEAQLARRAAALLGVIARHLAPPRAAQQLCVDVKPELLGLAQQPQPGAGARAQLQAVVHLRGGGDRAVDTEHGQQPLLRDVGDAERRRVRCQRAPRAKQRNVR
eukprot:scaffold55565_cov75-Phaeocystis_antarctica.AAC.3